MGRDCCNVAVTMAPRTGAVRSLGLRAPAPTVWTVRNQDAHHFAPTRTKIWELMETLHCSIVGTCLSTAELRKILGKLGLAAADDSDHDLHSRGVSLAGQNSPAAKLLHKALDDRHALAIRQFGRAKGEAEVRALWRDASQRGDIPGPYWALLTHPATSYELLREAFGHVHMLSHLVGAANRADIRRLAELETAKQELEQKVERQQSQLHTAVTTRDRTIHELQTSLSAKIGQAVAAMEDDVGDGEILHRLVSELERRLSVESRRRATAEERLAAAQQDLARERRDREAAVAREAVLRAELAAAETSLQAEVPNTDPEPSLDGLSLLYVGGRPNQVAHLRALGERMGAAFLHHDGGIEEQSGLLAGLASRADLVLFPVDCVSHEAALTVKRLCRQAGKPFVPLRTAGQGAFLAALAALPGKADLGVTSTAA
jgi:Uncharacterized protein conserved in bacteria (DUF2325)